MRSRIWAAALWGWGPARFASELYTAASDGFYANAIMVAAYYGFVALVLALAFT